MFDRDIQQQINLMNQLRKLWEQHVYWTRFFIISTAADLGDLQPVTDRLLRNPKDFAQLLTPLYGKEIADQFQQLLTTHLLIGADLVNAAKNQQGDKADEARKKWYENAEDIAQFLAGINPYWDEEQWKQMLFSHLQMTEEEATLRLQGNYAQDIMVFDSIEEEALKMADYMSSGMIKQFFINKI